MEKRKEKVSQRSVRTARARRKRKHKTVVFTEERKGGSWLSWGPGDKDTVRRGSGERMVETCFRGKGLSVATEKREIKK